MIISLSKFTTAKAIWSQLKDRFVQDSGALLHTFMQQTHVIEQHDMSIDEYYSTFDRFMSALISIVTACTVVPCPAHKFIEKFFTYRFVMGVRPEFDSLRARLLHSSDTLTMAQALSELLAEETRLRSMSSITGVGSHSVLAAPQKSRSTSFQPCEHCKKTTYRSENYFAKFPEKLADFRVRRATCGRGIGRSPRGSVVVVVVVASSAGALSSSWVLDSGTSFHVTSDQSRLASTTPVTEDTSVQTANGILCHVTHNSTRVLFPILILLSQIFSLYLSYPWIYYQLAKLQIANCFVGFDDSSCFVQDRHTGDVIGTGCCHKSSPRLYILGTLRLPSHHTSPAHVLAASGPTASFASGIITLVIYVDLVCLL
jgi:hypothetical protein